MMIFRQLGCQAAKAENVSLPSTASPKLPLNRCFSRALCNPVNPLLPCICQKNTKKKTFIRDLFRHDKRVQMRFLFTCLANPR